MRVRTRKQIGRSLHACGRIEVHILKKAGKGVYVWKEAAWPRQNGMDVSWLFL